MPYSNAKSRRRFARSSYLCSSKLRAVVGLFSNFFFFFFFKYKNTLSETTLEIRNFRKDSFVKYI